MISPPLLILPYIIYKQHAVRKYNNAHQSFKIEFNYIIYGETNKRNGIIHKNGKTCGCSPNIREELSKVEIPETKYYLKGDADQGLNRMEGKLTAQS